MNKKSLKEITRNLTYAIDSFVDKWKFILLLAFVVFLVALPFLGASSYFLRIVIMIGIYAMLGMGLNMLISTGLVSLGHAGFYGVGAYTYALLATHFEIPFIIAAIAGAVMAGLCGLLISLPTLKLKGPYLTVVTMGFGEVAKMIFINWKRVTRGAMGIRAIPNPSFLGYTLTLENNGIYYLMLIFTALIAVFCYLIMNSKYGRAFAAIKEDEQVGILMGMRTTHYRELAFALSAIITGLVGAFYASFLTYIDPNSFTNDISTMIISVVILGGMGTIRGAIVGAVLLIGLPELSRSLMEYRFVLFGLVLIVMMRWRPQGILGWKSTLPYKIPKLAKDMLEKRAEEKAGNMSVTTDLN